MIVQMHALIKIIVDAIGFHLFIEFMIVGKGIIHSLRDRCLNKNNGDAPFFNQAQGLLKVPVLFAIKHPAVLAEFDRLKILYCLLDKASLDIGIVSFRLLLFVPVVSFEDIPVEAVNERVVDLYMILSKSHLDRLEI